MTLFITADTCAVSDPIMVITTCDIRSARRVVVADAYTLRDFLLSVRDFADVVKRLPPQPPEPAPFGWREPIVFSESQRRRPRAIFACGHRAARRDLRRRRRTRWLSELRT